MVLRKITIDNSVKYIPKNEQTKEIKQNPTKIKIKVKKFNLFQEEVSQTRENKTKKIQKKIVKGLVPGGFGILK